MEVVTSNLVPRAFSLAFPPLPQAREKALGTWLGDVMIIMSFLCPSFLGQKYKMMGDCCIFKSLRPSVGGKDWMRLRPSVNGV